VKSVATAARFTSWNNPKNICLMVNLQINILKHHNHQESTLSTIPHASIATFKATALLEAGTDLRYIQKHLIKCKTTEVYCHVSTAKLSKLNPLTLLTKVFFFIKSIDTL
jgi:site-specific recombinase XerD